MIPMYHVLWFKMTEVGTWLEGSRLKHCLVIWLTNWHTGVIKVTNELNEDIIYFTYLWERKREWHKHTWELRGGKKRLKKEEWKNRCTDRSKTNRTIHHLSIWTYCRVYINQLHCSYVSNKDMKCLLYLIALYIIIHMDTTYWRIICMYKEHMTILANPFCPGGS